MKRKGEYTEIETPGNTDGFNERDREAWDKRDKEVLGARHLGEHRGSITVLTNGETRVRVESENIEGGDVSEYLKRDLRRIYRQAVGNAMAAIGKEYPGKRIMVEDNRFLIVDK